MMSKLLERQVLLVKNESSYGEDSTPTAASNAIPICEKTKPEFDINMIERGHPFPSLSKIKPLAGARYAKLAYKVELFGSGAVDTPPRVGDSFEGCSFEEEINADENVTYKPASENLKSNTIYHYVDGLLYKLLGAVGNMKLSGKNGEPVYCDFEMSGLCQENSDASIVTPTFESNYKSPPLALSVSFTLDSVETFILREFEIDMGIPIIPRPSMVDATGYAGFCCGKRNPSGKLVVEATSKATYDFLTKLMGSTEVATTISITNVAGNQYDISLPYINFTNVDLDESDGLAIFDVPISLNIGSNDDEISIIHK